MRTEFDNYMAYVFLVECAFWLLLSAVWMVVNACTQLWRHRSDRRRRNRAPVFVISSEDFNRNNVQPLQPTAENNCGGEELTVESERREPGTVVANAENVILFV